MAVQGIIYLPHVGKAVSKVGKFTRCPAHGNVLAWLGRPLPLEEFNTEAQTVLLNGALYGMQPMVKLVEVVSDTASEPAPPQTPKEDPKEEQKELVEQPRESKESVSPEGFSVEPLNDGFVTLDMRGESILYRGQGEQWENDISLVTPFATEAEARALIPADATKPAEKTVEPSDPNAAPEKTPTPKKSPPKKDKAKAKAAEKTVEPTNSK